MNTVRLSDSVELEIARRQLVMKDRREHTALTISKIFQTCVVSPQFSNFLKIHNLRVGKKSLRNGLN